MADAARERPQAVLFLCGHNQVRSPIAAALAKHLLGGSIYAASAGVLKGETDPFVTAVMDEIGIDLSRHKSVTLDEIEEYEGLNFDLVVSLSPEAHHRALDLTRRLPFDVEYWPIPDPTARHSRMSPSTPGVTPNSARTCGIRDAQLANRNPLPKKTM